MKVPFLDLKAQYESIRKEIGEALEAVLDATAFAGGPFVSKFEEEFAPFCQCKHAVGVGSGTDALWTALIALGVGPGDEVITAVNTFIATAEAIGLSGAKPVFVDVNEKTCNMDPEAFEAAIGPRTRAVIPVHLYGQTADMDPIVEIARKHDLRVIEDASQSPGAEYKGRRAGSIGDVGCFSFHPGNNLGAYGEAGAVVTDDEAVAAKIRMFRDHGQAHKYHHAIVGWNARMDGFQGAVLSVNLRHLAVWTEARRQHAQLYDRLLADIDGVEPPFEAKYAKHVYHVYAVRVPRRDEMIDFLNEKDVHCAIHYPAPLHLQEAYASLGYKKGAFPVAEKAASESISLPMYPELAQRQIEAVVDAIRRFMEVQA
jgi:dTDP-4-amino-4,6-dideoxygalactose transaminase